MRISRLEPKYTNSSGYKVSGSDNLYNGNPNFKPALKLRSTGPYTSTSTDNFVDGSSKILFGSLGAVAAVAYIGGTDGIGAAAGGAVMLNLSLGEIAIGTAQVALSITDPEDNGKAVVNKASTIPGVIAYSSSMNPTTAAMVDGAAAVAAGGNPIKSLYNPPGNIYKAVKKGEGVVKEAAETYDTYNDAWSVIKPTADKFDEKVLKPKSQYFPKPKSTPPIITPKKDNSGGNTSKPILYN